MKNTNSIITKSTLSYLGNMIHIAQYEQDISSEELCQRVNITTDILDAIHNGSPEIPIGIVFECCFVLKIPLLGGDSTHIHNLSTMMSYMHKLLPAELPTYKSRKINDNF